MLKHPNNAGSQAGAGHTATQSLMANSITDLTVMLQDYIDDKHSTRRGLL